MESQLVAARGSRRTGGALAAVAGFALLLAIGMNEAAVRAEAGGMTSDAGWPSGLAALFAFLAALLGIRASIEVERRRVAGPAALAVLAAAGSLLSAYLIYLEPALFNIAAGACIAGPFGSAPEISSLAVRAVASPGPCGYQIPHEDIGSFYPAAMVAAAAGVLALLSAGFMVRGRLLIGDSSTQSAS